MKVAELKKILEKTDESADVLIEYMPRAHEYIAEIVMGTRMEGAKGALYLFGATDFMDSAP